MYPLKKQKTSCCSCTTFVWFAKKRTTNCLIHNATYKYFT